MPTLIWIGPVVENVKKLQTTWSFNSEELKTGILGQKIYLKFDWYEPNLCTIIMCNVAMLWIPLCPYDGRLVTSASVISGMLHPLNPNSASAQITNILLVEINNNSLMQLNFFSTPKKMNNSPRLVIRQTRSVSKSDKTFH